MASMAKPKYTVQDTERLIEAVRCYEAIYNPQDENHRDLIFLNNTWKSVARKLNLSEEQGTF